MSRLPRPKKDKPMSTDQFIHWLWGYFEIADPTQLGVKETALIKEKLGNTYEEHIEPNYGESKKRRRKGTNRELLDVLGNNTNLYDT